MFKLQKNNNELKHDICSMKEENDMLQSYIEELEKEIGSLRKYRVIA